MEPKVQGAFRSQAAGTLVQTGGSTDLAIGGDGYFVVETPWGEGYTRDGRFTLDAEGRLVTVAGNYPLLGQSGPIVIIPGARVEFSQTGDVRVDDQVVEKVRVVNFENPAKLEAVSGSLFRNLGEAELKEVQYPRIIQGYVEASNVNIIQEMMELIYLSRAYNINTKMISTRDGLLTRTLEMGKTQ